MNFNKIEITYTSTNANVDDKVLTESKLIKYTSK